MSRRPSPLVVRLTLLGAVIFAGRVPTAVAQRPAPAPTGAPATPHAAHQHATTPDSSFDALQQRGKSAMGVDQYTSVHRFDDLADGGRIELQRDVADSAGVRTIREHLRTIAAAFSAGDFQTPGFVHAQQVPGTTVMADKRAAIRYEFRELPRGGEVRITTLDPVALRAVHNFLAFQRTDHRVQPSGAHTDPRVRVTRDSARSRS